MSLNIDNPNRFVFVDEEFAADQIFFIVRDEFPWPFGFPFNVNFAQDCVQWIKNGTVSGVQFNDEWNDVECSTAKSFLCRRETCTEEGELDLEIIYTGTVSAVAGLLILLVGWLINERRKRRVLKLKKAHLRGKSAWIDRSSTEAGERDADDASLTNELHESL